MSLPLASASADVVFGHSVLEAVTRPGQAITEMVRTLRAGGVFAVASVEYDGRILAGPHEAITTRFFEVRQAL